MRPSLHVLRMPRVSPLRMLHLEEALLRHDPLQRNVLVLNRCHRQDRCIVLGISGKPEQLVHVDAAREDNVPLVKRFTGGGTVLVDDNVQFCGFIMNKASLPNVPPYPGDIMKWTERLYRLTFAELASSYAADPAARAALEAFELRENDYCLGEKKIGGNAQSLIRTRWAHHTSFLWELDTAPMTRLLTVPAKRPAYRGERSHDDFVRGIAPLLSSAPLSHAASVAEAGAVFGAGSARDLSTGVLGEALVEQASRWFSLEEMDVAEAEAILAAAGGESKMTTKVLPFDTLPAPVAKEDVGMSVAQAMALQQQQMLHQQQQQSATG